MVVPGFGKVHMARPVMSRRPYVLYRDTRRRAMPRDILVDMVVGTILFSVIYDVARSMLGNKQSTSADDYVEREIESVEAVVIQDDSDDERPFKGQRIIIDILDSSDTEGDGDDDASNATIDTEIIEGDDDDVDSHNRLP